VFDSTAQGDDVDGMQFVATCTVLTYPEVEVVSEYYFQNNFLDSDVREWWYRPPTAFVGEGAWRFYQLEVDEMYLIDLDSFEETRVDSRIQVDIPSVFSALSLPHS
jgi:hypothetical protein